MCTENPDFSFSSELRPNFRPTGVIWDGSEYDRIWLMRFIQQQRKSEFKLA